MSAEEFKQLLKDADELLQYTKINKPPDGMAELLLLLTISSKISLEDIAKVQKIMLASYLLGKRDATKDLLSEGG